ncbi:MAG: Veg family protein [Erysipelotrichia bacterium]|nr:Veg family protein [Erysipelotrichia bacterium]
MGNRSKNLDPVRTIDQVKDEVTELINCKVRIYNNFSKREKPTEGLITAAYKNLFVLQTDENSFISKKTFTYSDLITGGISIELSE